jgi:hypothetical protein
MKRKTLFSPKGSAMPGTRSRVVLSVLGVVGLAFSTALPAAAQEVLSVPQISYEVQRDISEPLRDIVGASRPGLREGSSGVIPKLHPRPVRPPALAEMPDDDLGLQTAAPNQPHGHHRAEFPGVGANGYAPPDTNGAVGTTQYVQWVNVNYAVYDKTTGARILGPSPGNSFWSGFGGPCETSNDGDPIAQFDKAAQRWVMAQPVYSSPFMYCVAVSTTADATGSYYRYAFSIPDNYFPDYPKLGVWPDAYYVSANAFNASGTSFQGALACALDRNAMLAGQSATAVCFQNDSTVDSLLPSDLDGSTPPPAGAPATFVHFVSNALALYRFHVDFAAPGNSTFTGPTTIGVNPFSEACGGGACIPQSGTIQRLDSLGDRLMYRLAYRNFGDHESLVVNHSVVAGSSVGVRWYELRQTPPGAGGFGVYQQGTFAPDTRYRWMGSIAMDKAGDIALGYSLSSSSMHPSIAYTVHVPGIDALGTMQAETILVSGGGSQTGGLDRWGDYSSMSIDPVDDCTFWYTNEYLTANGSFNWSTAIASFKLSACGTQPLPPPNGAPDGLAATLVAYNEVDLGWNDHSTNEDGFQILRCTGPGCTPTTVIGSVATNVRSYKDTSVAASTTYVYKVQAYNGGGTTPSVNPATVSATTPAPPPSVPLSPSNLSVTARSKNSITLRWQDNSSNETNFDIERCTGAGCTNFALRASVGANVTSYQDTGLARRTTYRYRLKARNGVGSSTYTNTVSATTN